MRGIDSRTESLFAYVTPESFVPQDHPLRAIRKMADLALSEMSPLFSRHGTGRRGLGSLQLYQKP